MRLPVKELALCICCIACRAPTVDESQDNDFPGVSDEELCLDVQNLLSVCEEELYDALRESAANKELAERCVHRKGKVKAR